MDVLAASIQYFGNKCNKTPIITYNSVSAKRRLIRQSIWISTRIIIDPSFFRSSMPAVLLRLSSSIPGCLVRQD